MSRAVLDRAAGHSPATLPPVPHGYPPSAWFAEVEPAHRWRIDVGRECRGGAGRGHGKCGAASALARNRPRKRRTPQAGWHDVWWPYCPAHAYGRWVRGGHVWSWQLIIAGI